MPTQAGAWKQALLLWPVKCCCYSIYYPLRAFYLCGRHATRAPGKIDRACRRRLLRTRKIRKSKPIIPQQHPEQEHQCQQKNPDAPSPASFLRLPLELRLKIYDLVLGEPCLVEPHLGKPQWHPRPCNWQPGQRIRGDDEELQGDELRTVVDVRAYGLLYSCQYYRHPDGSSERRSRHNVPWGWWSPPCYCALLRTCRTVYGDLLYRLYGENTVSLVSAEMVRYFGRNASPEGLQLVQNVHTSLVVTWRGWESRKEQEPFEQAVQSLQRLFPTLKQLDLNVTIVGAQPMKPEEFWKWLRKNVLERHLTNLDNFTLRVSTYDYQKPHGCVRNHRVQYDQLVSWDENDYQALKATVCKSSREDQSYSVQ
ncbi:hypothetical protein PG999_006094 [Apiospora kogelbergensis]|uniref:DUF7730 domain-containing protein n=1 Tax=Apiospora kogelbergensis TaxID=1337665 RepID=A0AAW0QPS6_9PEZI